IAASDIGNGWKHVAVAILGFEPLGPVAASGDPLGRIEAEEIATRDLVEHAPDLGLRVRCQIGRCRAAPGPAFEIEAQAITADAPDALVDRPHAASHAEGAIVHVRAIGKAPDVLTRSPGQSQAVQPIIAPTEHPRPGDEPAELTA